MSGRAFYSRGGWGVSNRFVVPREEGKDAFNNIRCCCIGITLLVWHLLFVTLGLPDHMPSAAKAKKQAAKKAAATKQGQKLDKPSQPSDGQQTLLDVKVSWAAWTHAGKQVVGCLGPYN